jgi:hypothetical protein
VENSQRSDYFERRAEEERVAAESAADERAARTHLALAARYAAKARGTPVHDASDDEPDSGGTLHNDFTILP